MSKARYTFLASRIFGWAVSNMNGKPMTVVATSLKLRGWRQLRRFFKLNGSIKRQLNASCGLVQYRLKADFLRLRFSTLSVWVDGQAVDDFTNTGAHREAIASFDSISDRKVSGFLRWEVEELQEATWQEAAERLKEQTHTLVRP